RLLEVDPSIGGINGVNTPQDGGLAAGGRLRALEEYLKEPDNSIEDMYKARGMPEPASEGGKNMSTDGGTLGGIDFRTLPVTPQPGTGIKPNLQSAIQPKIPLAELDNEWSRIQEMVNQGNIPSGEKIREYVFSCCQKGDIRRDIEKALVCISDILRLEEDYALACEPGFIQLLSVLELDKSPQDLQLALSAVSFQP
ncbi:MAG: hypothetical protein PHC33_03250, partial [Candidatus Omnitrophica bacterium]|nr:hypothetical protein [Candidatus Omnitrophota bacterium]